MKLDRIIAVRNNKTVYRDGELCMKVFGEGYSKADILNEALNQARVEETGLAIPRIHEVTMIDGKWAIISDYIRGKTMAEWMEEDSATLEARRRWIDRFVDLQMEVLSKDCPLLTLWRDKMTRKIRMSDFDETTKYELLTRLDTMPRHTKLCHGDFNPSNIILAEDGTPYILDWSHATQGNASADAARSYLLFWLHGKIDGAKYYLDSFCEHSQTSKQYVQKWMPIVAASQSVKGNEKEREFLRSWVNVVDYE